MIEIDARDREIEELRRQLAEAHEALRAAESREADAVARQTEDTGRRSEARFRAVLEKSAEIISLTGADGKTTYLTPAAAATVLGWTSDDILKLTPRDQVVPEDRDRLEEELRRLVQTGARDMALDFRVRHKDGSIRWIECSGTNLLDDPDVHAIVGNYRDITARKEAEESLRAGRDLLEHAQAIAHVGSWTSALGQDAELHWTPECRRIFDVPEGVVMTVAELMTLVHPDDREQVRRATKDAEEERAPLDIEHRVLRADGRTSWVHARASVERRGGLPPQMVGVVQDVTERHLAVEALRESDARYRQIIDTTSEGVWLSDASYVTTFVNQRMANMVGFTPEEMIGQSVFLCFSEEGREIARRRFEQRRARAPGFSESYVSAYRRKDGTVQWALAKVDTVFDAQGRFEGTVGLLTDLTEPRKHEEVRNRLAAIVESSNDAISSVGLDGTITSWNPGAERMFQYAASEVLGKPIFLLVPKANVDDERHSFEGGLLAEAVHHVETSRLRKDGTSVEVAVTTSPVRDAGGTVIGLSEIARDLTQQRETQAALRRSEDQLRQAQKMEAVGRLAGGVAHDFNNLLAVILSYASMIMDDLKPGDPLRAEVAEIARAGERASELTRQLLAFSRQQLLQPRILVLGAVVEAMKTMLRRLLGEDIVLTVLSDAGGGRVLADAGQVEQVVMNLAVNARDAMPHGGKLTVETANVTLDDDYVGAHVGVTPGEYVLLAISDTGTGMDAETKARIFEPFYTTKERGKGTGLGLSTVFGIVEQSGGHIWVYSELGHGTTFKVYFPRTARISSPDAPSIAPGPLRGTETILLVEDDETVRTVACVILRRSGYHVLEASNGGEAFLISKDFGAKIHLIVTDVVMPRMSGRKLVEMLAPDRPEMKVLFASGYTDDTVIHHGVLDSGLAFLQKPFTPDTLLRKVRAVLDGTAAPS